MGREEIERASQMCAAAGAWLVLDNTYENFVYDRQEHFCLSAPHVINIFSFSKVSRADGKALRGLGHRLTWWLFHQGCRLGLACLSMETFGKDNQESTKVESQSDPKAPPA